MTTKLTIVTTIAILSASLSGCGCSHDNATNRTLTAEQDSMLTEQALRDIAAILNPSATAMERERSVFEVRARETRLRDHGYETAADRYVKLIEQHVLPQLDSCDESR